MHHVTSVDWSFTASPMADSGTAAGLARRVLIGRDQGAVHTELAVGAFRPGGWLGRHVHSFEEALYVLRGELVIEIGGTVHRLVAGDYAFIPLGIRHTLANDSTDEVRWLSVNTPLRLPADAGRRDTYFDGVEVVAAKLGARAARPPFGDPTLRLVGHYEGSPPLEDAVRVTDPARGRRPAGADTALLAYSGIAVKMLVDRVFGADLLTMFTVDYEIGGAAQSHDHPFEEAYFFLAGEVQGELDGVSYTFRPGDVAFAGVGSVHGFWNVGTERVRWIETQAPQPPARHAYRWVDAWKRLESEGA